MRASHLSLLVAASFIAAGIAPHAVAEDISTPELTSYQLDNGLEVILAPDHKVPKVSLNLQYRVGSLNEPTGRAGFAHLFEHLMLFAGTPSYPRIDQTFSALGIDFNGFTVEDTTTYVAGGMASSLPVILSTYADQMANIGASVDQIDLDTQRSVVLNEMRQNVLDSPAMSAVTALRSGMFPVGHPYSRSVLGSIPDLEAATLDDVRGFFNAYYVPNNAVLVITGDFDLDATKAMIEDTFGRVARGPDVAQPAPDAFEATRFRIEAADAVAAPTVYLAFNGPASAEIEANAALLLATDLLNNDDGVLRKMLVNTGLATSAGGSFQPGRLGGRFVVYASASPGVSAEQLEGALRDALASFVAAPVNAADVDRARRATLLGVRTQLESFASRASYIAASKIYEDDVSHVFEDHPYIVAATAESLETTIDDVFVLDEVSTAVVVPGARGDYPSVIRDSSGAPEPIETAERAMVDIPILTAGGPVAANLPEQETATLSNGIRIIHYHMEGSPQLHIAASVTGGVNNDPRGKEGIYTLAAEMAWRGAGERDLPALARTAKDIGAVVGTWAGLATSGAYLSVPPDQLTGGLELLADVVQSPRFDQTEWDVVKAGILNNLIQRDANQGSVATRALAEVVFFPAEDQAEMGMTVESLSNISLEDVATAYEEMITPRTMTIYSVGDLPLADVVAALEPRFGSGWTDEDAGIPTMPSLKPVFPEGQQVYVVPMPGTAQATIHIARSAPGTEDPNYPGTVAVANLLAIDFTGRLNSVIREQKGYSYGVRGELWDWYEHDSALTVTIPVQIDATGAALAEALAGFDSLVTNPITEVEVTRSVNGYHTGLASLPETAAGLFGALVTMQQSGNDLEDAIVHAERMTQLGLDDVQSEASKLAQLDRAVIIIAGDPDRILPQLAAMGITSVGTITMPTGEAAGAPIVTPASKAE